MHPFLYCYLTTLKNLPIIKVLVCRIDLVFRKVYANLLCGGKDESDKESKATGLFARKQN